MAKVLIDLGSPGLPNSGNNLPDGGDVINDHINEVYNAFSRQDVDQETEHLHATGVYQQVTADNSEYNEGTDRYVYDAQTGDMLQIAMDAALVAEIILPEAPWSGAQIKIFRPTSAFGPDVTFVKAFDGDTVQNLSEVAITRGVEYIFTAYLDHSLDGTWSMRSGKAGTADLIPAAVFENEFL